MIKKIIAVILLLTAAWIYFYYQPISRDIHFALDGSIRSAEGEILEPCTVKFDGKEAYFLFGNQPNILKGTLQLIDEETAISSYIHLDMDTSPDVEGTPLKNVTHASGWRYRGKALGAVTCDVCYNDDRTACVVVDNGNFYCVSSLSESETRAFFDRIAKIAQPVS